jgi:hypothetical protein
MRRWLQPGAMKMLDVASDEAMMSVTFLHQVNLRAGKMHCLDEIHHLR